MSNYNVQKQNSNPMTDHKKELYRLRMIIGVLGLVLPIVLFLGHKGILLSSMSHYYYTSSGVFFIGIIFSIAIVLLGYYGYEKLPTEKISDNAITTIAAIFALTMILLPTASSGATGLIHFKSYPYLFGHCDNKFIGTIHLISAGIFISLLGYMSYFKFTLSPENTKGLNRFYRISGLLVWGSIAMILILIITEKIIGREFSFKYVWWFECIAVESFSIAWLRKAKAFKFLKREY